MSEAEWGEGGGWRPACFNIGNRTFGLQAMYYDRV